MSKYTTELRYLCETMAGLTESQGYQKIPEIIEKARPQIFAFNYPIFDEEYRSVLETKIIKHFYTREIGYETAGRWLLGLDEKMNLIMPYYNKLYGAVEQQFNPLHDTDIWTTSERKEDGNKDDTGNTSENTNRDRKNTGDTTTETNMGTDVNNTSTGKQTDIANDWDYYSDTPQGGVDGLATHTYLTNARNITKDDTSNTTNTDKGNTTTTGTVTDTLNTNENTVEQKNVDNSSKSVYNNSVDYVEHVAGKRGSQSYASLIKEFAESLINIDMMIIDELDELFMRLW